MGLEVFVEGANFPGSCPDQGSRLRQGRVQPHLTAQGPLRGITSPLQGWKWGQFSGALSDAEVPCLGMLSNSTSNSRSKHKPSAPS
jgi:hypothetical protein